MNEKSLSRDEQKQHNRSAIIQVILEKGPICRRDIAEITGLTPATISNLSGELLAEGLLQEEALPPGEVVRRGPSPIPLNLSTKPPYIISISLGIDQLRVGLVNLQGQVIAKRARGLNGACSPETAYPCIQEAIGELCQEQGLALRRDVLAAGFTSWGTIQPEQGQIFWHREPALRGARVKERLQAMLGLPVFIDNQANASALAEAWFGAGRAYRSFLYVLVSEEVNGVIMFNRQVLTGSRHASTILPHLQLEPAGPECFCGRRGCLTALASDQALAQQAQRLAKQNRLLPGSVPAGGHFHLADIVEAARNDDAECQHLLSQRCRYVGQAIATLLNLVDVQAVILAMHLDAPLLGNEYANVSTAYSDHMLFHYRSPEIFPSQIKTDVLLVGPAAMVIANTLL